MAPDSDLPITAVARSRSALADLNVSAKLDPALPVQAYPDGTDSSGSWRFTVNATVTARYVDATGYRVQLVDPRNLDRHHGPPLPDVSRQTWMRARPFSTTPVRLLGVDAKRGA